MTKETEEACKIFFNFDESIIDTMFPNKTFIEAVEIINRLLDFIIEVDLEAYAPALELIIGKNFKNCHSSPKDILGFVLLPGKLLNP